MIYIHKLHRYVIIMTTAAELEDRRNRVRRLKVFGLTDSEIAEKFNVSRRTIQADMKAIKQENKEKYLTEDPTEDLILEMMADMDYVRQERIKLYMQTDNPNVKLGCLNKLEKKWADLLTNLQSLGLVEKAAERLEVSGNLNIDHKRLEEAVKSYRGKDDSD